MIKIPYFKQNIPYSCGPVVLQMIFRYYGKVFSEQFLIDKLKPNNDIGTRHQTMIDFARKEGFFVYVNQGSSLEEIFSLLSKNIPVIVHYIEPATEDGHYSVVVDVQKDKVVLNDPWNGEKFKLNREDFEERWKSKDGKFKRWIMAVSNTDVHFGKQYLPI